jgi:plastocyanin
MARMRAIAVTAIAVLGLSGLAAPAAAAPEATIVVGDNFLRPGKKTIAAGTRVRFDWTGFGRHHIVKSKGPGGPIASPATAKDGVNLAKRLRQPGVYRFLCTFHPAEMRLKLTVK